MVNRGQRDGILAAAAAVREAQAMVVGAGAGMGVDSGLPDFRGDEGFWKAYPPFAELGLSFFDLANPGWFSRDPALAWGFYGHRLELYRRTEPHAGFRILQRWAQAMKHGCFVFTSNVDGHFQQAGIDPRRVVECHGSIHNLQCAEPCSGEIWANTAPVEVDERTFRADPPLPGCRRCGGVARPNILMFGDGSWHPDRTGQQEAALRQWLASLEGSRVVVVELGAGTAVPTVRWQCETLTRQPSATLVRINPREPEGPGGTIELPLGALAALEAIDAALAGQQTGLR